MITEVEDEHSSAKGSRRAFSMEDPIGTVMLYGYSEYHLSYFDQGTVTTP
jgi:hypothetical protein